MLSRRVRREIENEVTKQLDREFRAEQIAQRVASLWERFGKVNATIRDTGAALAQNPSADTTRKLVREMAGAFALGEEILSAWADELDRANAIGNAVAGKN